MKVIAKIMQKTNNKIFVLNAFLGPFLVVIEISSETVTKWGKN